MDVPSVDYPSGEVKEKFSAMDDTTSKVVLEAVKNLRQAHGDTQQAFAHRLGLAISTVVRYELSRPPSGAALALLAKSAQDAGQQDLKDIFLAALAAELGLHQNLGMVSDEFLWLMLENAEQRRLAVSFYTAFMTVTRPEKFHKPPAPEASARMRKALDGLVKAVFEPKGDKK